MEIVYTPRFLKLYRKLPGNVQKLAVKKEKIFRVNMYDQRLKTHQLTGELAGEWAFSINYQYRIMFEILGKDRVLFLIVGTHAIYR